MNLKTKSLLVCAAATLLGTNAMAQTAAPTAPAYSLSFNVGVTSDYRFRSVAQTSFNPALQAGVDFAHASGFYLGAWGSNVSWIKDYVGATDGTLDVDLYGGFKGEVTQGLAFDVGVITYQYPNNTADRVLVNANTTELYGALSYGIFTAKYSHALTNLFGFADSKGSGYLDLSASVDLGDGWSVVPHVGRQWVRHSSAYAYTDYALALNKDFGHGLSASAAVIGTNADKALYVTPSGRFTGRAALVLGIKYTF